MHVSETMHLSRAVVEPLEAVIFIRLSRSYKREFSRELKRFIRKRIQKKVE
jgi:hypothetical protein